MRISDWISDVGSSDLVARSVRAVSDGDGPAGYAGIVVGGAGHPVGRGGSARERVDELVAWARRHLPVTEETHRWRAPDYQQEEASLVGRECVSPCRSRGAQHDENKE